MAQQRLNLLDGLRGLAAITVVLCHYKFFFLVRPDAHALEPAKSLLGFFYDHGFRAVELFWLLSGFVFTHVYCFGKQATTREFVVSRFARLYPLHVLTLAVVALLQLGIFNEFGRYLIFRENDFYHLALNLLFVSGWGFQQGSSFNDVIWSVSVEVAIYALFWLLRDGLVRWGPLGVFVIVLLCGFVVLLGPPNFIAACGFYFFAGSALALLLHRLGERRNIIWLLIVALAIAGALGVASGDPIFSPAIGLTGIYAATVLLLVELDGCGGERIERAASWLGDCSYGIYLWHFPMMLAFILVFTQVGDVTSLATQGWFLAVYVLAVVAIARLTFVYFERSTRLYLRNLGSRRPEPLMRQAEIGG